MDERYQNGKIYKLTCDDPTMVYYGSTITTLKHRLSAHNAPSNDTVSKKMIHIGGLQIHLVEEYPCNSRRELEEREQYFIDNNDCINEQNAFITDEHKKQYIEYELKQKKKYYQKNKVEILEKKKKYYEKNKEEIKEKARLNRRLKSKII